MARTVLKVTCASARATKPFTLMDTSLAIAAVAAAIAGSTPSSRGGGAALVSCAILKSWSRDSAAIFSARSATSPCSTATAL